MTPDQIAAWGTLLGSIFTGASVWFGIFVYRRDRERSLFSALRTSLIDIQTDITHLDALLSEGRFTEVGDCIAEEIKAILGPNTTKAEVISFLENDENHDMIATAIHMGINRSETSRNIDAVCRSLQRLPYQNANQIPLLREALTGCIFYAVQTARGSTSPRVFDRILGKADARTDVVLPAIQKRDNPSLIYEELSLILSATSQSFLKAGGQAVVDDIRRIVAALTNKVSALSDAELRALRRRLSSVVINDPKETTMIENVFARLDKMRHLFSPKEWDSLVEAKARIQAKAHQPERASV